MCVRKPEFTYIVVPSDIISPSLTLMTPDGAHTSPSLSERSNQKAMVVREVKSHRVITSTLNQVSHTEVISLFPAPFDILVV